METPIFDDNTYDPEGPTSESTTLDVETGNVDLFDDEYEYDIVTVEHVPHPTFGPAIDELPVGVQDLLGRLARLMELTYCGRKIEYNKNTRYTPFDLLELVKLELNGGAINIQLSAFGLVDMDLSNLSITGSSVRVLSGSGCNVLHEYWEKMDGTDMYFFSLSGKHFVMFFLKHMNRWAVEECSHFIPEGAELVDRTIHLRALPFSGFRIYGSIFKVEFVQRHKIGQEIICKEGIIAMVNGRLERLKKQHTVDLVTYNGFACSMSGKQYFSGQGPENTISEYTLGGTFVRYRPDKTRPDTDKKYDRLRRAHTVEDLNILLKQHVIEPPMYIPQIYPGYDIVSKNLKLSHTPSILVQGRMGWIYTPDKNDQCRAYKDYTYAPLSDFIDAENYFSYTKYCKFLERSGMSFYYGDVREFLFRSGIFQYYEHWRVSKTYRDGMLSPDRLNYHLFYDCELVPPYYPIDRRMYDLPPSYLRDNYDSFIGEGGYWTYNLLYKTIATVDDVFRRDCALQQIIDLLHNGPCLIDILWTTSSLSFKAFHDILSYAIYETYVCYNVGTKMCSLSVVPLTKKTRTNIMTVAKHNNVVNSGEVYSLVDQFTNSELESYKLRCERYFNANYFAYRRMDCIEEIRECIVGGMELDYIVYDTLECLMEDERGVKIQFNPKGEWIQHARLHIAKDVKIPYYTRGYITKFSICGVTYYASELLGLLWCDVPGSVKYEISKKDPDLLSHVMIACHALSTLKV